MADVMATTNNAMFEGLSWLASKKGFRLALVNTPDSTLSFELCGTGVIVVCQGSGLWTLKMLASGSDIYPCNPVIYALTKEFFGYEWVVETTLLKLTMLLECLYHWLAGQIDLTGLLATARKHEHMNVDGE